MKLRFLFPAIGLLIASIAPLKAQPIIPIQTAWSPSGNKLALFDYEDLIVYDHALNEEQRIDAFGADENVYAVTMHWSAQQDKIAMHAIGEFDDDDGVDGFIRIWDAKTGEQIGQIEEVPLLPESEDPFYAEVVQVAWLPDGERLSVIVPDESVNDWPIDVYMLDGTKIESVTSLSGFIGQQWTADGEFLVTVSQAGSHLEARTTANKTWLQSFDWAGVKPEISLSPNSHYAASVSADSAYLQVWVIDPHAPREDMELAIPHPGDHFPYAFVPHIAFGWQDNSHLWSLGLDNTLYIWRLKAPRPISQYPIDIPHLQSISPDGTKALYGQGQSLRMVAIETGEELASTVIESDAMFVTQVWELSSRG